MKKMMRNSILLILVLVAIVLPGCASNPYDTLLSDSQKPVRVSGSEEKPPVDMGAPPRALEPERTEVKPSPPNPIEVGSTGISPGDIAVATIQGAPIGVGELLPVLRLFFPSAYEEALDVVIKSRVVDLECERLGFWPDLSSLDALVDREIDGMRQRLQEQYRGELTLEMFLEKRSRCDLATYRLAILRAESIRYRSSLLARSDQLQSERREIRRLVLKSKDVADDVHRRLREGADFAAIIRKRKVDDGTKDGRLPPLSRENLGEPVGNVVFSMEEGDLSPVLELPDGRHTIIRLLRVHPPMLVDLPEAEILVARDLQAHPLEQRELLAWNNRMMKQYGIQFLP